MNKNFTEEELSMPRRKPRSIAISAAYRLMRVGRITLGPRILLRFFLNASWLTWRLAFELASDVFGPAFQADARGISEEMLKDVIPPGGTVLDVGCGPGRWSRIVARHAGHVLAVDASAANIAQARRDSSETNIEYVAADVRDVIADRHFDVALLIHVLEHIEEVDAFIRTMARTADTLIIEVPDFETDPLQPARHALGCRFYTDADHVREYTWPILRTQLCRNGLQILRQEFRRGTLVAVARRTDTNSNANGRSEHRQMQ